MGTYSIYALFDPRTNEPRYVGKSRNADRRFISHLRKSHGPVRAWIESLADLGMRPYLVIISSELDHLTAMVRERHWIFEMSRCHRILNWADSYERLRVTRNLIYRVWKQRRELLIARQIKHAMKGVDCGLQRKIDYSIGWNIGTLCKDPVKPWILEQWRSLVG